MSVIIRVTRHKGRGVFANRFFMPGELVVRGRMLKGLSERTTHSFQVDFDTHVELDEPARVINHSCDPNLGIQDNEFGGYDFIALCAIQKGEEVTWDYETSEYISIAVKRCCCGAAECRRTIIGFQYREEALRKKYETYIAGYLKR